ncbi:MAG: cysteine--tRNA ligase [Candidatus Neomarinimicrobiota bacterium]|nr:MAG: cysteine--tRNA ligase [Candidatus Neomarinimicrobiota bacterium]
MAIVFYNTLTRKKEKFKPITPGIVKMYTCGPTVYNYAHIGNFRAYTFEDLLRRYLKFKGFKVIQVMNLTDVDDKIIKASKEKGVPIEEFTTPYKKAFFEDIETLGIEKAEFYPEATKHINEMVDIIKKLLAKGHAYKAADGSIYFKVSSFEKYGQLANLNVKEMRVGERVASDEYEKEEIRDFALWKSWKPEDGNVYWNTELGKGRPGWHIECSAMSMKYLGNHFDIHTGGVDNIFPHHENEIAQSECATGEKFVNYWLHCEHLLVNDEKMSKSLGNVIYPRELIARGVDPVVIRYTLLSTHYRQKLNFTTEKLISSASSVERLLDFYNSLDFYEDSKQTELKNLISDTEKAFEEALDDNLNISEAMAAIFELVKEVNKHKAKKQISRTDAKNIKATLDRFDTVLNIFKMGQVKLSKEIRQLIDRRAKARKEKNWKEADRIREYLLERGIILEDTPQGTRCKKTLIKKDFSKV